MISIVGSLRYFSRIKNGTTPASGKAEYWGGNVFWATPEDLGKLTSDRILATKRQVTAKAVAEANLSVLPVGSIIISTRAPIGHMAINDKPMSFNQGCRGIIPGDKIYGPFLYYLLSSRVPELNAVSNGTTFVELSRDELAAVRVIFPELDSQRRIADFLDERTTRVDGLIAKKTRLLELLAEQRQALITRAVTKGLDPSAPMKPSGIDWLGDIPAHWEVKRVWFDCKINPKKSEVNAVPETEVSFIPMEAIGELGGLDLDQVRTLDEVYDGYTYLADGDVCVAKITPCFENGKGALASSLSNGLGFGTTELHVLRAKADLSTRFLFYLSISQPFRAWGAAEMLGAGGQKRVPENFFKDWPLAKPKLEQQEHIADYLDEQTAQIDHTVTKVQASIGLLREYRAALINYAVTGRMKIERTVSKTAVPAIDAARVRVVVGAEIIHRHRGDAWAGRTKLQKLLYLAEAHADIHELRGDYSREAAGPMAGSLLDAVEAGMADAGFYQVRKHQSGAFDYPPLSNAGQHIADLEAALGERVAQLRRVIDLLRDCKIKKVEGVATLYAVWNEALMDGHDWTAAEIITAVLTDWHPEKPRKFSRGDLATLLDWMRSHHLTPRGVGPRTRQPGLFA